MGSALGTLTLSTPLGLGVLLVMTLGGHLAVACLAWIALPLVLGFWRVRRAAVT